MVNAEMKPLFLAVLLSTVLVDKIIGIDFDDELQLPPLTMDVDNDGHLVPSVANATDRPLLGRPDGHEAWLDNKSPIPVEQQTEEPLIGRPDGHEEGHDEDLIGRPDGHEDGHDGGGLIGRPDGHEDGHDGGLIGRPDGHDGHGHDGGLIGRPDGHDEHGHNDENLLGRPDGHEPSDEDQIDEHDSEEEMPAEPGFDDGNEPLVRCKRPLCMTFCSFGFQTDASGCPECKCLEDPCQDLECRDGTVCHPMACESTRSCVKLTAECIPSLSCPEPMCANFCPNGYGRNAQGCMTCTCESSLPENVQEDAFPCPEVMCATFCPTGYQRNERGCMTCTCNNETVEDPSCGGVFCELGQVCRRTDSKSYCAPKPMCLLSQEMSQMKRDRPTVLNMTRMFVPECEDDGAFRPKQCHPLTSQCWCVDDRGKEMDGTRIAVTLDEEDQLRCRPNVSVSVHLEMVLTFMDTSYYFHGDEENDEDNFEDEDYEKELSLNLDKSQGTLEDAFSQWLLVERQYVAVIKVEQNSKTTVLVQLEVKRGDLVDLPSAVEHMRRKMRMGHCTVPLENIPEEEEVYFAPNPDTLNIEHQYNTEEVLKEYPEQAEAFDGRGWYKYCFGDYHILLAVATMLVLFMILALFSAVMVHRHRRNHRSLQFRHHKLENQLSHEQKNFMEGEVAGDNQSESTVILVSADALEKKHPIA